jgi:hypothetical protein
MYELMKLSGQEYVDQYAPRGKNRLAVLRAAQNGQAGPGSSGPAGAGEPEAGLPGAGPHEADRPGAAGRPGQDEDEADWA